MSAALVVAAMVCLVAMSDLRSEDSASFLSDAPQEYPGGDVQKLRDLVEKLKGNLEALQESASDWQEAVAKKAKKEKLSLGTLTDISHEVDGAEENAERFLKTPGFVLFAVSLPTSHSNVARALAQVLSVLGVCQATRVQGCKILLLVFRTERCDRAILG